MEEVWADIPNFGRYKISNLGRVWNSIFRIPMKTSRQQDGHIKISLIDDGGVRRSVSVHVLVAEAFVERPYAACSEVVVLDGDLMNVAAYNLAWRSPRTAYMYARQMRTHQPDVYYNRQVRNKQTGVVYKNVVDSGVNDGVEFHEIWMSCHDERRVAPYGHTYEFVQRV